MAYRGCRYTSSRYVKGLSAWLGRFGQSACRTGNALEKASRSNAKLAKSIADFIRQTYGEEAYLEALKGRNHGAHCSVCNQHR